MKFTVKVDLKNVSRKNEKFSKEGQFLFSSEVLKDSNYFAPQDTGNLIASSHRSSNLEQGQIVWDTPYAKKLYYNPQYNFSKDKNPNARGLWFEVAKSHFLSRWIDVLNNLRNKTY
ncbi:minor capsid protein [Bacillus vallismortis]|uniref:minor capsid protein n=1 Tax=Bacillus vallismortis TaxID=72361 RepID=UPI000C29BDBA|nr:minor capsid protein [Bacillus vallismortis]PJZ00380.1 minor capsid protein [Bacillus vallismortis]